MGKTSGWGGWLTDLLIDDPDSAGDDYVAVSEVRGLSQGGTNDKVDMTSRDSRDAVTGGWKESLQSYGEVSISGTYITVNDDPGQDKLRSAFMEKRDVDVKFRLRGAASGYDYFQMSATVDALNDTGNHDDRAEVSFTLTSTGTVTQSTN